MTRIAILDDYQGVALEMGDWEALSEGCEAVAFTDHLAEEDAIAERLADFEVVVVNRERTPFRRGLLEKLPKLGLLVTAGMRNASIDVAAAADRGVVVSGTAMVGNPTPELAWGLIIALARNIPREDRGVREGKWQQTVGQGLGGKVLGIIGLGRLGVPVARVGLAFDMEVIAWSPNLTEARAAEHGATLATKEGLFSGADFISIHMPLSERSQGLIGAADLARMKESAYLINTSRGPIVDEQALIQALREGRIAGAGLDVYDIEPLPLDHPLRSMENTVLTPHLGYVEEENYRLGFAAAIDSIQAWLDGKPIGVIDA